MLSPRWRKVARDVWANKTRTLLVVLSIAVGVFAIGMIGGTQAILQREMDRGFSAINPSHVQIYTDRFDEDLLASVRRVPGVRAAEGRTGLNARIKTGPDTWQTVSLTALADFDDMQVDKIWPETGAWPPPKRELLIERASLPLIAAEVGDIVQLERPDGKMRAMRIAGLAHDVNLPPASFSGTAFAYISGDTLEWLGMSNSFNRLHVTVTGDKVDVARVETVTEDIKAKVERSGRRIYGTYLPTPGKYPGEEILQPILLVLGVLGFLVLGLSSFLVINTITAILAQHVRQIGMMKAIGARAGQVAQMYFVMVGVFGALALLIALPLGAYAAARCTDYMMTILNFNVESYRLPFGVLGLQAAIAIVAPLLAAIHPVLKGTRTTVREAIQSYGVAQAAGSGRFVRWCRNTRCRLQRAFRSSGSTLAGSAMRQGGGPASYETQSAKQSHARAGVRTTVKSQTAHLLPRPLLLSLRNTFRRRGRLVLTLITLTLAGAIFMGMFSVRASLMLTLDEALDYWKYDAELQFARAYRSDKIEAEALKVPGVVEAESWGQYSAQRLHADGTQSANIYVVAPPANTQLLQPILLEGRWLLPDDENAVVLNTEILKNETDIKVGDSIVLKLDDRETDWHVVGIVKGIMTGPIAYANAPYFNKAIGQVGRGFTVQVVTEKHDGEFQAGIVKALEEHYKGQGMRVRSTQTTADLRSLIEVQFNIVLVFLLVMVSLLAVVGGLGLMGTMSINVLERIREIGVLRAIGASTRALLQLVIVEGAMIGIISWLIGVVLAVPFSQLLSVAMGMALLRAPLSYTFSPVGPVAWLAVVLILASLASAMPARNAARISVRESLAYE